MGKGTGIKDMPGIQGIAMAGKMHGGGVNLQPKKENTGGGMDLNQRKMMAGDYNPAKSGIISGGHPKGGFMHKSKSMGNPKDGDMKGDQSNTKKDYSMDKGNTDPNYKSKKDGESKGDQSASDKDYSTPKYPKGPNKEKLKMVKKDGKNVPFYAADGEGKMQ